MAEPLRGHKRYSPECVEGKFSEIRLFASGPRLLSTVAGVPLRYPPTTKKRTDLLLTE